MESRYQKLVSSTLLAWRFFTTLLPSDHQVALHEKYEEILNNGKFWKLAKHNSASVRILLELVLIEILNVNPLVKFRPPSLKNDKPYCILTDLWLMNSFWGRRKSGPSQVVYPLNFMERKIAIFNFFFFIFCWSQLKNYFSFIKIEGGWTTWLGLKVDIYQIEKY